MSWRWHLVIGATLLVGAMPAYGQAPASVPTLAVTDVHGAQVTLTWTFLPSNPDAFVVEGGMLPGQTLASVPVAGTRTTLVVTLAPGNYYARVHAITGGIRSGPSNEVLIGMGGDLAPSAPGDVMALALGHDVALSWRPTFDGGVATDTLLDVSGPVSGSLHLGAGGAVSFADVPAGLYTLTLRSRNAAGASASTTPVTVTVPGATVAPLIQPPLAPAAPALPVRYEHYVTPRLVQLAAREQLGAVVAGATTEFDALLRLRDWVSAQWDVGNPEPYPPWDAMVILDWIRAGYTSGFCAQYSQVFLQSLAALGVPARYVEIGTPENPYSHYTTEVWSNDYDKWVVLDAHFNSHYTRNGVPLSVVELRDVRLQDLDDEVEVHVGTSRPGQPSPFDIERDGIALYYYTRYHLNANHATRPDEAPFERWDDMVEYLDGQSPSEAGPGGAPVPSPHATRYETGDRTLVEWGPNRLWLAARRTGAMQLTIDLQHTMPSAAALEYRVIDADGEPGPWVAQASAVLIWNVQPRDRIFEARLVNAMGRRGPVSSLQLVTPAP